MTCLVPLLMFTQYLAPSCYEKTLFDVFLRIPGVVEQSRGKSERQIRLLFIYEAKLWFV